MVELILLLDARLCIKRGHLDRCCRTKIKKVESTNIIKEEQEKGEGEKEDSYIAIVQREKTQEKRPNYGDCSPKWQEDKDIQIDTGTSVSIKLLRLST